LIKENVRINDIVRSFCKYSSDRADAEITYWNNISVREMKRISVPREESSH